MTNINAFDISRRTFLTGLVLTPFAISGCSTQSKMASSWGPTSDTSALSMLTAGSNYSNFTEALKLAKPDVNIQFQSYAGYNMTDYIAVTLQAGKPNDIFVNTYSNYPELQKEYLVDLSGYDFINNFKSKLLNDVSIDGAIYLIPSCLSFYCPYYNKTLFEKHGWEVPKSLTELEELVPKIKEAGVQVVLATTAYPGSCMGFFWDVLAPEFTATLEGIQWREDFLKGNAKASGTLDSHVKTLQKWIDLGMFNIPEGVSTDSDVVKMFKEGNTAFLVTVSDQSLTQNNDGTGDQYGLMPWLSADGSNNIAVTNVRRYYGISKALKDNETKMDAALNFMDFLATEEAQESLITYSNLISPLKNSVIDESDPLYNMVELLENGHTMSLVHPGWESLMADMGEQVLNFLKGEISSSELLSQFDEIQERVLARGGLEELATVTEDLSLDKVAMLVGSAFAKATDSDCALISLGDFHDFGKENSYGINGSIFAGVPMTENTVCTFNPLGWSNFIKTGELKGSEIKEWAQEGFLIPGDDKPYDYVLVTKGGTELDDSKIYKVALVNETESRQKQCNMQTSEKVGQDATVEYIKSLGTIDTSTVKWK